jgi:hypothetical protein
MRILAIADAHGNYGRIPDILEKAGEIDLVLIAGDLTNFGPDEKALSLFDMFDVPVLAVPGNCDLPTLTETLNGSKAVNLHNRVWRKENVAFAGFGGSNPTPFCTPFEIEEQEIGEALDRLVGEAEENSDYVVLLTHAPPYGTLDRVETGNVGCRAVAGMLGRVDLIVSGHIHEDRGFMEVEGTTVINTGMASGGSAAVIELDAQGKKTDVRMILA